MSLTVPKAGVIAGRAAQVPVEASDTGATLGKLGASMLQAGTALETDRLDREAGRLQVDMSRDLGNLAQEFNQMNNPDQIERDWQPRLAALRQSYATGVDENGVALVDPKHRDRVLLAFDDLANRHALAIGRHSFAARADQRSATRMAMGAETVKQSATAPPEALDAIKAMALDRIASDVESGLLSPSQGEAEKQTLLSASDEAVAITMIDQDPQGFLAAVGDNRFTGLDGIKLARYSARARRIIQQRDSAAQSEAERQASERETRIGKDMAAVIDVVGAGKPSPNEAKMMSDPEYKAHPDYPKFRAEYDLLNDTPNLRQLTPAQLRAEIKTEENSPGKYKYQTERVQVLRGALAKAEKGWATDAPGFARSIGIDVPDLAEFDPRDPKSFAASLADRKGRMSALQQQGYTKDVQLFSADERAALKQTLAATGDPNEKFAFIGSLITGGRADAPKVLRQIYGDTSSDEWKIADHVIGLMFQASDNGLVTDIFSGQKKLAEGTINMPSSTNLNALFDQESKGLFANSGARAQLQLVTAALYANSAPGIDPEALTSLVVLDGDAKTLYAASLQRSLGARADQNGDLSIGGIQTLRNSTVLMPTGVALAAAKGAFDLVEQELSRRWVSDNKSGLSEGRYLGHYEQPDLSRLTRASRSGAAPDLGDNPGDVFSDLLPQSTDGETFVFMRKRGDRLVPVMEAGDSGKVYSFSLRQLVAEMPQ